MFSLAKELTGIKNFLYAEYYGSTSPIIDKQSVIRVGEWCLSNGVKYLSIENITSEWVSILKSYGIYVMTFTYNDPETMYKYYDMGVDCIFTDFSLMWKIGDENG